MKGMTVALEEFTKDFTPEERAPSAARTPVPLRWASAVGEIGDCPEIGGMGRCREDRYDQSVQ